MTLTRFLKLVFLAIGVLYVAVSSLGQALAGTMPMADGHLCTMTVPEGRMSADKYNSITHSPHSTVTRDLNDLVDKGALRRTGERRHTRYHLSATLRPTRRVTVDAGGQIVIAAPALEADRLN